MEFIFNPYAIAPGITSLILFLMVFLIISKQKNIKGAILLGLYCFGLAIWLLGYTGVYLANSKNLALQCARFGFLGVAFLLFLIFHFVFFYIGLKHKKILYFMYPILIFFLSISFSSLIYNGSQRYY